MAEGENFLKGDWGTSENEKINRLSKSQTLDLF